MRIFTFLLLLIASQSIAKDQPNILPQPSWLYKVTPDFSKKVELRKIGNGYFYELFDEQINIKTQTVYNHFVRNIVNETGLQDASEVSISFAPEYQTLNFHFVRVIRNGSEINHLSAKDIKVIQEEEDVEQYQYNGRKRAFIILKDIRKGDRIEAAYSVIGFNPVFNNRFTYDVRFVSDNPILNYYQTIIAEPGRKLNFSYFRNCPKPEEIIVGESKVYHWNNPELSLWKSTSNSPSWFDPYPYFTVSEFSNWNEVANWALATYDNYKFELPSELKSEIANLRKLSGQDDDEFARLALRYVQNNIRYLGLEIGINTHKPHSPGEVYRNGYGDCKDKALLLATILRSENIPAYAALVNTEVRGELINEAVSPNSFDHVIVAIGKPGIYTYVDPTRSYQRGAISETYVPGYEYTLLIKEGETNLRHIALVANNIARIFERLKVKRDGPSSLTVNTTYRSGKADETRSYFATTSQKDMADLYEKYYSKTFEGIKLSKDLLNEDDTINNVIKVTEEYDIPEIWRDKDSAESYFLTYAKQIDEVLTDPSGISDKQPVSLSFPSSTYYTLDLQMPGPWSFPNDKLHIKNDSYEFNFEVEVNGSLITLKYSLVTFKDHIPAEELTQYKKDYNKIADVMRYRLSYGDTTSGASGESSGNVNWIAVLSVLAIVGAAVFSFYKLNSRSLDVPYERSTGHQLGGWTIVLGLTIVAAVVVNVFQLFDATYFLESSYSIWKTHGNGFVVTAFAELAFLWLWALSSLAIAYWYFKRRDIFPTMFMGYVTLLIVTHAVLYIMYLQYANGSEFAGSSKTALSGVFKMMGYGAIWCTYLSKSERVKGTFLKAYSE